MKRAIINSGLVFIALSFFAIGMQGGDSDNENALRANLIGTWKQVSMKVSGVDNPIPQTYTTYKHLTPSGFVWLSYDKISGRIIRAAGGTYTLNGNTYIETIEYGIGSDYEIIKNSKPSFTANIDGDKWYHSGRLANGQTIDEIWERVKPGNK